MSSIAEHAQANLQDAVRSGRVETQFKFSTYDDDGYHLKCTIVVEPTNVHPYDELVYFEHKCDDAHEELIDVLRQCLMKNEFEFDRPNFNGVTRAGGGVQFEFKVFVCDAEDAIHF